MDWLRNWWAVIVALVAAVASASVALYRVGEAERKLEQIKGEPIKLQILERDVARLRCDIGNVKRLIRNQPENDC